jgi:hypothetical protein
MSTTYLVSIDLQTRGNLVAGIDKVSGGAKAAAASVSKLGTGFDKAAAGASSLFSKLDGVVSKVVDVGLGMAKWGAIGAAGVLTYGVVHLNNELEQTKIALGAIFQANGVASDLPTGMRLAQDTIQKMRVDAQKLPGEFEDLRNIFTSVAIPGFQSGASVDKLREVSGKIMAFAKVAQIPMDQAAREAAMLMEGRAGAHNVLGMKLAALGGDKAKAFNQEDSVKRFAEMDKYLDKYKDSIDEFGKSWEGISSTTVDFGKQFLTLASAPVFDRAKAELSKVNDWFMENRDLVNSWATYIGDKLGDAFDFAIVKIEQWWPAVQAFGKNAYDRLSSIWTEIQPSVEKFGNALQEALRDPGTLDKILLIAKIWAGGKIVGSVAGTVGAGVQTVGGGLMIAKSLGILGGGAAAGAGAEAAGFGGAVGMGGAGAFLGAMALAAAPVIAALTALGVAGYAAYDIWGQFSDYAKTDTDARAEATNKLINGTASMSENVKTFDDAYSGYVAAHNDLMVAALDAASAVSGMAAAMEEFKKPHNKDIGDELADYLKVTGLDLGRMDPRRDANKARVPVHPGGAGGTHIAKIEITVSGNDEPNRVAALVVDKFNKMARHRTTSPHVTSYSAGG